MFRILIFIASFMFLYADCTHIKSSKGKREELIKKAIAAFKINDTIQLYSIIDTTYYFGVYGKDGFIFNVDFIFNKFKTCRPELIENTIKITPHPVHATEYVIPFCRTDSGTINPNSFDFSLPVCRL